MITQKRLKEVLDYNPETGDFINKIKRGNRGVGAPVGTVNAQGYRVIYIDKKCYRAHHLAWLYANGSMPKSFMDHINHNRLDNRIINLRESSKLENNRNMSRSKKNKSGIAGLYWSKQLKKWRVQARIDGRMRHIGVYRDYFEAACARKSIENKLGYHINHGR